MLRVTVLAATGQLGRALLQRLAGEAAAIVAVGRDRAKLDALPGSIETRVADLADPSALAAALADAQLIVSCANARFVPAILAALPGEGARRLVLMGSTRCFSTVPDATAHAVRSAAAALADCPVPSVLLLATLIYGGRSGVIETLARQIRRFPILPLPGASALVQPIHLDDVAACLIAALLRDEAPGAPIVIAGPSAMPYGRMVRAVAASRGLPLLLLPLPGMVVAPAMRLARRFGPSAGLAGSALRLLEDKNFDIAPMRMRLGVEPREFAPTNPR